MALCAQIHVAAEEVEVAVDVFSRILGSASQKGSSDTLCSLFRLMQVIVFEGFCSQLAAE